MLFIFDWDGTILDSTDKIARCMQQAVEKHQLPAISDSRAKSIIGLGLSEAVRELFPSIDEALIPEVCKSYSAFFVEADRVPCPFFPNVEAVLDELRAKGHLLAVATGKSRRGLDRVLSNLNMQTFFDASRCADETASKPNPLMLLQLLDQLNCSPADAVMIGDTDFDLNMANNAAIKSIAVQYGAHDVERLQVCRPEIFIDDFSELLDWLVVAR
jgi:phosphoglycolate phosphatase